jgi:hypothetical protein
MSRLEGKVEIDSGEKSEGRRLKMGLREEREEKRRRSVRGISTKEDLLTANNRIDQSIVEISILDQAGCSKFNTPM